MTTMKDGTTDGISAGAAVSQTRDSRCIICRDVLHSGSRSTRKLFWYHVTHVFRTLFSLLLTLPFGCLCASAFRAQLGIVSSTTVSTNGSHLASRRLHKWNLINCECCFQTLCRARLTAAEGGSLQFYDEL